MIILSSQAADGVKECYKFFLGFKTNWAKPFEILSVYFMVVYKPYDKEEWKLSYQRFFPSPGYPLAETAEMVKV